MGEAIVKLSKKVFVPAHPSVSHSGRVQHVDSYVRSAPAAPTSARSVAPNTETEEWKEVGDEIESQGMGNCYQAAFTLLENATELGLKNPIIVQGLVAGRGELEGVRFPHAWLEADGAEFTDAEGHVVAAMKDAYDFSSGNRVKMPDALYRKLGDASNVTEFTPEEALDMALETETYGPWPDDLIEAHLKLGLT